jgi:hypothetical protein
VHACDHGMGSVSWTQWRGRNTCRKRNPAAGQDQQFRSNTHGISEGRYDRSVVSLRNYEASPPCQAASNNCSVGQREAHFADPFHGRQQTIITRRSRAQSQLTAGGYLINVALL